MLKILFNSSFYVFIYCAVLYPNLSTANDNTWSITKTSDQQYYQLNLQCDNPPIFGDFQRCVFTLSHNSTPVSEAKVFIDGGMPAHHHGLPTKPQAIWDKNNNHFKINGLKYSMPGEWQLKFLIDKTKSLPRDIIIIELNIE